MEVPIDDLPEYDPDGPPCAPYPNSALNLGGFRWLGMDGELMAVPAECEELLASLVQQAEEYGEDPELIGASIHGYHGVNLDRRTLAYWEDAAARGGYVLQDLIQ